MELKGTGSDMFVSNDTRYINKCVKKLCGTYYYANHYEKIIKRGYFLNSFYLNGPGIIINYGNNLIIMTIGIFTNDIPCPLSGSNNGQYIYIVSQPPYQSYHNNIINADGSMVAKKEYYSTGIKYIYLSTDDGIVEIENKDVYLQIYIKEISDFHNDKEFKNIINDIKLIDKLPATLHEMYKTNNSYLSLNFLLENEF